MKPLSFLIAVAFLASLAGPAGAAPSPSPIVKVAPGSMTIPAGVKPPKRGPR